MITNLLNQKKQIWLLCLSVLLCWTHINAQITYTSASQVQSDISASQPYGQGTVNQRIIRLDITSGGTAGTNLNITKLNLTINGNAEIATLKAIKSSSTQAFPDLTLAPYATVANPQATESITLTGASIATAAANSLRIWLIVDLKSDATIGNPIDIVIESVETDGVTQAKPTISTDRNAVVAANISGTKTIKASGGDYTTLKLAITDLNDKGIGNGGVTLILDDDATYTQTSSDFDHIYKYFRQISTQTSPLTIKRSGTGTNKPIINVAATSSTSDCMLGFLAADYVTVDGLDYRNTTPTITYEMGLFFRGLQLNGCTNNVIKNCNIDLANTDKTRTYAIKFNSYATSDPFTNNDNSIFSNNLKNADAGVNFNHQVTNLFNDKNNSIYNNTISGNFGLEAGAISFQACTNTSVYGNIIDGSGYNVNYNNVQKGIVTTSSTSNVCGGYINCYNNIVRNMTNIATGTSARISGINVEAPVVNLYNNMVSGLKCESTTSTSTSAGITINSRNVVDPVYSVWNNSVNINQVTPTGHHMAALIIGSNEKIAFNISNNIFVNASTGTGINHVIYSPAQALSKLDVSSNNNLYFPEATDFIVYSSAKYATLTAYKTAVATKDQQSISELPPFVSATDLHLQTTVATRCEGGGKTIAQVTSDFDGDVRNASMPDIGADEGTFKPFNLAPVMNVLSNIGPINNNVGEQTVNLSGIDDSNPTVNQALTISAKSSNPAIIPNPTIEYVSGNPTGVLKFTPSGSGKGNITITVRLQDDGGIEMDAKDTALYTFVVNLLDPLLNNEPTIDAISALNIFNNSPQQIIQLSGITDGDPYKDQDLTVTVSVSQDGIISQPTINYTPNQTTGSLTFEPLAVGSTMVTVKVTDNGGHDGESVDVKEISFMVSVKNFDNFAFTDKFNDGTHNWWVSKAGQYSVTENDDNLNVKANKNEKWTSFGVNLPTAIDISETPYMYLRLKPNKAEYPFKINAYIGDGVKSVNIQKRVMYGDSTYTELFFDFTGMTTANLGAINQVFFALNGDALTWTGTALIDQIDLSGNVIKTANICALPNISCAKDAAQRKVFITDIENASSLSLSGGSSLIQNASFTPIANKMSTLSFDIKPGVTGKEKITVTANGSSGYANKAVTFWVTVEENLPPTIDQQADVNVEVGNNVEINLTGINDGNSASNQDLIITAQSDNTTAIPSLSVDYIQAQTKAVLKFKALSAAKNITITVTVNDGQAANNLKTMSFKVDAYTSLNHAPTINPLDAVNLRLSEGQREIVLTGLSDGDLNTQDIVITATSSTDTVVANTIPELSYEPGETEARFTLIPLKAGSTTITLTLTDNGGDANNNGNQTSTIQFDVNVLNDPLYGYVVPTDNFDEDLSKGIWAPNPSKHIMQATDFDGFQNVIKVDMVNKSNWDGIMYNMPEVNVKDAPYMSMDVYPVTTDLYWHVYFYDVNAARNANGTHAERKLLTKGQWNSIVLDYRPDGYLLDNNGVPINTERITNLLFNMHDKDFPFPFTTCNGTFYLKNIRVGDKTIFPSVETTPTIIPVLDQAHLLTLTPAEKTIGLSGISDGNFNTAGLTLSVTSSNPSIADPQVTEVNPDGTATLRYTPGTITGNTQIVLTVNSSTSLFRDTFNITIVSNEAAQAVSLDIDPTIKYQTMRGFGTFQNEYRFADLYATEMGSSAVRIGFIGNQFELANDNNDPNVIDMSKFNRNVFNWDYMRALRDRGVEDFVLTSWSPPAWMKGNLSVDYMQAGTQGNSDATDNKLEYHYYEEFAEMMVAFCKLFKEEMGMELTGIGLQNEPAFHEPYASAILDIPRFVQLIKVVGPRLEAEGLSTKIFMPEQVFSQGANSMDAYINGLQADPVANQYCTVIATHGYASNGIDAGAPDFSQWSAMWNNCQEGSHPKELWMTETFKEYKQYSDAMYMANAIYGSIVAGNVSHWTTWSFTGAYFNTKTNKPTSMLYATRNFSKFIRPGAQRVSSVVTGSTQVLGTTFANNEANGNSLVTILINNGTTPYTIKLNGNNLPVQLDLYQTTEALNCEKLGTVSSSDVILLPAKSVTTLVGSFGNHAPTIDQLSDITIFNSKPAEQTVSLTGITDGDLDAEQTLSFTVKSSNTALISNPSIEYIQGASTATLRYTHVGADLGSSVISVTVKDDGGIANGAKDSVNMTFKITVAPEVNNVPTIGSVSPQTVLEDAANLSVNLSGISDGDAMVDQPLTIDAVTDNPALITSLTVNHAAPNTTGTLTYAIAPNASGIAKITLTVNDHGGTPFNNGDLTKVISFNITVLPVNDAPVFDALEDLTVSANEVEHSITITGINDGDSDQTQALYILASATNQATYFKTLTVSYVQGEDQAILTFVPKGTTGSSTVSVKVMDYAGIDNGGINSTSKAFLVTFTPKTSTQNVNSTEVRLYPNPAKDFAELTLPANTYTNYSVYNISGHLITQGILEPSQNRVQVHLDRCSTGLHYIKLTGNKQTHTLTFMVE